jgi:hypothetical protein
LWLRQTEHINISVVIVTVNQDIVMTKTFGSDGFNLSVPLNLCCSLSNVSNFQPYLQVYMMTKMIRVVTYMSSYMTISYFTSPFCVVPGFFKLVSENTGICESVLTISPNCRWTTVDLVDRGVCCLDWSQMSLFSFWWVHYADST